MAVTGPGAVAVSHPGVGALSAPGLVAMRVLVVVAVRVLGPGQWGLRGAPEPRGSCVWVVGGGGLSQLGVRGEAKVWLGCPVPWDRSCSPCRQRVRFAGPSGASVNSEA